MQMLESENTVSEIFESYSGDVFRYSLSLLKNSDDARDAVQEIFIKFIQTRSSFRGDCSIKSWLLILTRNHCFKQLNSKKAVIQSIDENLQGGYESNIETKISLNDALEKIGNEEFELIYLREYAGHSYQEIAEILNISIDNVKVKLFRVREQLRKHLR
jgi:RNA polymerase sigma factor (sigma-70 family)